METLPKFSGKCVTFPVRGWVRKIDEQATVSSWSGYETFVAVKKSLVGAAADWLESRDDVGT